jgi:hypothetical protein
MAKTEKRTLEAKANKANEETIEESPFVKVIYTNASRETVTSEAFFLLQKHLNSLYKKETTCPDGSNVALVGLPLGTSPINAVTVVKIQKTAWLIGNNTTGQAVNRLIDAILEAKYPGEGYYATLLPDGEQGPESPNSWLLIDQGQLQNNTWRRYPPGARAAIEYPAAPIINQRIPLQRDEITAIGDANKSMFAGFLLITEKLALTPFEATAEFFPLGE